MSAATKPSVSVQCALRWLIGAGHTLDASVATLHEYYERNGTARDALSDMSRRGAAGRMLSRLEDAGYVDGDGRVTRQGRRAAQ